MFCVVGTAYSIDLRERVLDYIDEGHTKDEAALIFKVNSRSIYRWQRLKNSGENIGAKVRSSSPRKLVPEKVLAVVEANPDATLQEYGQKFNVSSAAIHKAFKRLGITRKKNRSYILKETKKRGEYFKKK